jgi:hypothetical protein
LKIKGLFNFECIIAIKIQLSTHILTVQ